MTATAPPLDGPVPVRPDASVWTSDWPSPSRAYYTAFMMAVAVAFAETDRTAMTLLVQPIKDAFHLSDNAMGLLIGPVFALFYTICGVPTSRFIDRYNRKSILAGALSLWSAASVCCGLAQGVIQLATARLFLGVAESPNAPAIFSILSDSFPRKLLTRGIAVMQLGITVATGFTLIMTGLLIGALMHIQPLHVGGLVIRWWQLVFMAIGIPGLVAAAVLAVTVREPKRHGAGAQAKVPMRDVLGYMSQHWKVFAPFMGSSVFGSLLLGSMAWTAAFFQRTYGWAPSKYAELAGLVSIVATPAGLFLGAWVYERWVTQGRHDAAMRVVVLGRLIGLPFALVMPLMPSGPLALAMYALSLIVLGGTGACTNTVLQIISPNRMRAQITAIFFVFYNLIGQGLAPWLIGLISTFVLKDDSHLRYAILAINVLATPTSLFILWLGMKPYGREVEAIAAAETAAAQ